LPFTQRRVNIQTKAIYVKIILAYLLGMGRDIVSLFPGGRGRLKGLPMRRF